MFTTALSTLRQSTAPALLAAAVAAASLAALPGLAQAQQFVSVKGKTVNVRAQPNTRSDILWELSRGYPLQVTARQGNWLKVRDYEASLGWVHRPLTSNDAHHVVKARTANMRQGPGTQHRVVSKLQQHEVVHTLEKRKDWVKVRSDSGSQGWVSRNLLWGW